MIGDTGQDVGQPSLRIDIIQFGSDDQAIDRRSALSTTVRRGVIMPGIWEAK
jgi:hypothetical protein